MIPHKAPSRVSPAATRTLLTALAGIGAASSLHAASQTWSGTTDASWGTITNWAGGAAPGSTSALSTDVATFNSALNGTIGDVSNPIVIDSGRRIGGLSFAAGAGAYVIGSNAGNTLTLGTRGAGYNGGSSIVVAAGVANSQVIAAPLTFVQPSSTNGQYGFVNNATDSNVTLTLSGAMTLASTRPAVVVLDGANTGNNAITGNISFTASTQGTPLMVKRGAGTWTLSGANTMTGTAATSTNANNGIQVLDGVLSLQNNLALGSAAQVWIGSKTSTWTYNSSFTASYTSTSGGTLEVANGVTLDNGLTLNLVNGGTLRSNGTNSVNSLVKLDIAAATAATLVTTGASDVLTLGNAANDLSGGSADTVINVSGPGTVVQSQSSNYAGTWSLNNGTLRLGNANSLGSAGSVSFGSGSAGKLQLNGNNVSLSSVNTHATVGTPVIENGAAGPGTLTVNASGTNTYAGTIQDGSTGSLALAKSGVGSLNLTGANTYTGGTTISGGTLKANNSSGSATGSGSITVASGGTLGGSGTIAGSVTVNSGGIVAPGNSVGTLTVGSLTAASGSIFNFEFNSTPANDQIVVSNSDGLTLNGGGFNLYSEGTTNAWTTTGLYNLIGFAGSVQGSGIGALSVLNPQAGYGYTFGASGGYVTLDVAIAALISHWNVDSGGSWNTSGNWNNGVPNAAGEGAILDKALSAPATVTLDGGKTVGGLTLDSANGYTIAAGSGGTLSLDSGVSQASVIVNSGSHSISAPVALASNTVASVASGSALAISGAVSGSGSLTKSGAGSLDLDSANTYSGGTSIAAGTVNFVAGGLGSGDISINGATLAYKGVNTDDLSAHTVTIGSGGATIDVGANNVAFANGIGNGGSGVFTKSGPGTLTLAGNNTYTGATVIAQGALVLSGSNSSTGGTSLAGAGTSLEIGSDAALGAVPSSAGTNLTFNAGPGNTATLKTNAAMTINANRTVSLASGTGAIDTNGNNVTLGGALTGSGNFAKSGAGILTLGSAASLATGTVTLNGGTVSAPNTSYLPTGGFILNNDAALSLTQNSGQTVNNITVNGTNTIAATNNTSNIFGIGTIVGGSGTLTVSNVYVSDFTNSWSGFTGTIALAGTGGYRFNGSATGSSAVTLDLGNRGIFVRGSTTGITLGGLVGASGSTLGGSGGGATQAVTYTVGGANSDTTFAGTINDGAAATSLTKVGTGTLTLAAATAYTGATAINAGTLVVNGSLANTAVTVGASGTLGGSGAIAGATTVNGALRPDSTPTDASSRLTFGSTLALAGSTTFDIDGANYTGVTLSTADSLTFGGSLTFNFVSGLSTGAYDLFNFTDSNTGSFSSVSVASLGALTAGTGLDAGTWSGQFDGKTVQFSEITGDLTVSAVPEPASFAALAGVFGLAAAGLSRRRRA